MKKLSIVFSLLLVAAMFLAACSGDGQDTTATETGGLDTGSGAASTLDAQATPMLTETAMPVDITAPATDGAASTPAATSGALDTTPAAGTSFPTPASAGGVAGTATPADTSAGATPLAETPAATSATPGDISSTQVMTDTLQGAQIVPAEGREQLVRLSNWTDFSLIDASGQEIGAVQDYIINVCEAHILYMVVQPAAAGGSQMLVPFEAVTVNGGSIDAEARTISLALSADQVAGAPTIDQRPDLSTTDWESEVRGYWEGVVSLSGLDTGCAVSATGTDTAPADASGQGNAEGVNVSKLAYASSLTGASLQDENGTVLGQVQDALVEPESGQLFFLAISRQEGGDTVLVPMGAVNVPEGANAQEGALTLVLLVDNSILQSAPAIDGLDSVTTNVDQAAHDYWSQYIPLGPASP